MIEETTNTIKSKRPARPASKPAKLKSYYCSPQRKKSSGAGKTTKRKAPRTLFTNTSLELVEFNGFIPSIFDRAIHNIAQNNEIEPGDRLAKIADHL